VQADLNEIWYTPDYENMRDELLQLMMKFKLCYEIPTSKNVYIAPQLLTENQPNYEWDEKENLLLRYTYEFMPKGILLQFIVVMSESIWKQNVWKSGVILEKAKTQAEVIEYYGKREIQIRVSGVHKKELITIVMHELDKILLTYRRLKYDKLIPCNCTECKAKKEPYFYRFEILQKFVEDRQEQIQCQQSYRMVNVRGLVDDVLEKEYVREEHESPLIQNIYYGDHIDQGEKKMAKINQSINNSTVHGSFIVAESIKDSFNLIEKADIKNDLKEQLKQLNQAVETMIAELPKEKAEEVADDMKRLAEEAVKPSPSKKWYSVSIDGLTKAAENLGKVGEPVIKLAGKVLALLAVA
jgi:internalin A